MNEFSPDGVRNLVEASKKAAAERSDMLRQAAGDRLRIELRSSQALTALHRRGEMERLQALQSANGRAESELKKAAKRRKALRDQRRRVLGAFEDQQDVRRNALAQSGASQQTEVLRSQLSGNLSSGQAGAALSQQAVDQARSSVEVIKADLADLNSLREQGYIDEREWLQRSGDLNESLAKNNLSLVKAELAEKERAQRAAVELIRQEGAIARVALDERAQAIDSMSDGLKLQQGLLGAAAGLQTALADQEKARYDSAIAAADSAAERQKIEGKFAQQRVDQLLAAQEIERQQLSLSQEQANADLSRQGVLAEIAQLEAEIALEKLRASGASDKEVEAQERILSLRKKQVKDLGRAAIAQQGIQALQSQTLQVRQGTARRRLGNEFREDLRGDRGGRGGRGGRNKTSRLMGAGSGAGGRLGSGFDGFSDDERARLGRGDRVRGLRVITPDSVRAARAAGDPGRASAGVRSALGRLNRGGGNVKGGAAAGLERVFRQVQTTETSRVVNELKALHEAVREGNEQGKVPSSLTIQSPEPVQDATKIIRDLSRRRTR